MGSRRTVAVLVALAAVAVVGWGLMVSRAIVEGRAVREGGSWTVLLLWSLGAVVCLYAALVLLLRARAARSQPPSTSRAPYVPRHRR